MKIKTKVNELKEFLGKCPLILAKHSFLTCLSLLLLALIFGGFLFYKYGFLAQKAEPELSDSFLLKKEIHQEVLEIWQEQEKRFSETDSKEYPDPFKKTTVVPEKELSEEGQSEGLTD